MSNCHLTAEQWRVISYLYHPDQLSRRTSPSLVDVIDRQAVDRWAVVDVVERGLVQGRVAGEECTYGALKRLPEKLIRLRLTKAGIYRVSHDPQHLVLCAMRAHSGVRVDMLMTRLMHRINFGELCAIADKGLMVTYAHGTDIEVPIEQMSGSPELAVARITKLGRTFVGYL